VTGLIPSAYLLTAKDLAEIDALLGQILSGGLHTVEDSGFHEDAPVLAHGLPLALRRHLYEFRLKEPSAACLVRGFVLDDDALGPTPATWREAGSSGPTLTAEVFFYLCATILGESAAWSTKQDARLMHDIVPVEGDEDKQLGSGSNTVLTWHTEDGFSDLRADYLGLMCLRNHSATGTTVASVDTMSFDARTAAVLREPRFEIVPDGSHFQPISATVRASLGAELLARGLTRLEHMRDSPAPVSLLFGARERPYLRADQYFARAIDGDDLAAEAYASLAEEVASRLEPVILEPGDVLFLDNYRAVHGRDSFQAKFDGTDRWLKRLNLVRNLRDSMEYRSSPSTRVMV
jgi:Fe(II)/alpha-ketoglutarate-dependent arginine beta-hydroxylase